MIDQLKGIEVQGKGFVEKRAFELFKKDQERVAMIFGRNGTGKSTLAAAFKQLVPESFDERLSVAILKTDGTVAPVLQGDVSWQDFISVFDEKYIDKTVRLKADAQGIGTIVLFADLGDIDAQVETTNRRLKEKEATLNLLDEKVKEFEDSGNACAPEYHVQRMMDVLRTSWADKDREAKGNVKKSQVTRDLALAIAQMECRTAKKNILAEINKCKKDLASLERVGDVDGMPAVPLLITAFDEDAFVHLLNRHVEKPELNEREKRIIALMDAREIHIEDVKKSFGSDKTTYCPYCFRDIEKEDKAEIVASIEKVLSRTVEDYKNELKLVEFPSYDFDPELYEPIDRTLPTAIAREIEKCREIIDEYKADADKKQDNVFSDEVFASRNLVSAIKSANEKMSQLERMRSDLMALAARQRTIQSALIRLYKEEAHYQLEPLFNTYEAQLSAKKIKQDESNGLMAEIKSLRQEVQALEARKAGTDIAVGCINKSLQYIFVSDKRFTIEPCAGTYVLKSRGHNVRPADVSTGERHILALAYFFVDIMARHSTKDFYKDERIIVIDDPVSSYDQENKIGVYSFLMREIENVLAGNKKSRIVLFTHDIQTMLGLGSALESLMGCRFKQEKYAFVMKEIGDDGALKEFQRKHWHEYSCLLQEIYDFAQNGAVSSHSITIGNEMRRALEAYSTFLYRMDFLQLFRSTSLAGKLGSLATYFSARMDRIVFHGESHMQNQARALPVDGDFFALVSETEKKQTAKDVLCLLYSLDPTHIESHFSGNPQAIVDINGWLTQLHQLNDPS